MINNADGSTYDGVFLGRGNVTTWGFKEVGKGEGWSVRLVEGKLRDGESEGFLKVVSPST